MPVDVQTDVRRPSESEFADLTYELMACAFSVHNDIGRFCDEMIYKRLVAQQFGGTELEVPVVVRFEGFEKRYSLDMLVRGFALLEWKAVQRLAPEHRAQLFNYLLLCDLPRGKLVNVRPESIEHEFVNTTLRPADRQRFDIDVSEFQPINKSDHTWQQFIIGAVRDWGTGLDVHLYESAISHVFGGDDIAVKDIDIVVDHDIVGKQKARLTSSGAVFKVTTLTQNLNAFARHVRRFLNHTTLPAVHWVNITRQKIKFVTLNRAEDKR